MWRRRAPASLLRCRRAAKPGCWPAVPQGGRCRPLHARAAAGAGRRPPGPPARHGLPAQPPLLCGWVSKRWAQGAGATMLSPTIPSFPCLPDFFLDPLLTEGRASVLSRGAVAALFPVGAAAHSLHGRPAARPRHGNSSDLQAARRPLAPACRRRVWQTRSPAIAPFPSAPPLLLSQLPAAALVLDRTGLVFRRGGRWVRDKEVGGHEGKGGSSPSFLVNKTLPQLLRAALPPRPPACLLNAATARCRRGSTRGWTHACASPPAAASSCEGACRACLGACMLGRAWSAVIQLQVPSPPSSL